jgi:hypothetical protein
VTENVKFVDGVPELGVTDGAVRLPLSGQLTARTAGAKVIDAVNRPMSTKRLASEDRIRRR